VSVVPSAGLVPRGLTVVMWLAQSAAARWVVGVEACCDELAAAEGVVVCDGGQACDAFGEAEHAERIALEHCGAEALVPGAGVAALGGCASGLVGFAAVSWAAAAGDELWAAWRGADLQSSGHGRLWRWVCEWPVMSVVDIPGLSEAYRFGADIGVKHLWRC
jgi:hypothetical protein